MPRAGLRFTFRPSWWPGRFLKEAGPIASPAGLRTLRDRLARSLLCFANGGIGRRSRPGRNPLLTTVAARVRDAEIVLGVLIEIFCRDAVATRRGFPRKRDISFEYLVGAAADFDVGTVAVEGLIPLGQSVLLLKWPATIIPAARRLI